GTRSYFLQVLGITAASEPCWQATTPEENEGTNAAFDADSIFPYSIGHYVGQKYLGKGSGNDNVGVLDALRSVDTINQVDTVGQVINVNFANHVNSAPPASGFTYGRSLYHVVLTADWNGTGSQATALHKLLNKSNGSPAGYVCSNSSIF